ncbi:unnamed protein product [Amoebophrya sp. A120]|nr:unnamed protein product [Amoebophrya sp. A120]|eukprot:GSA120T00001955001.1
MGGDGDRKDVFLYEPEDLNTLPLSAEQAVKDMMLGLKQGGGSNSPNTSTMSAKDSGGRSKLPLESYMVQSSLFHRVFANLFYLSVCVLFRPQDSAELSKRCRSCLVTNWQDYLLYFREDKKHQRNMLEILPVFLTQLVYRALLDFFQLGPLGFIDAAQSVISRVGTIVYFELTGFTPQATTIHRSRDGVFVRDLVKHPYADVTMGAALLMESDQTELEFGSQDSRPPDGSVLSDLLQMRAREKAQQYSGILDPAAKEDAMNADKTRVDYLVEDLGQSLGHVVAVEKAIAGSYMLYSQQRKANREQRARDAKRESDVAVQQGGGGSASAGAGAAGDGTKGAAPGTAEKKPEPKKSTAALSRFRRSASTEMQRNITAKMFNAQLDKQKYEKAVRTCVFRHLTLPPRYSRVENAQFNTSWLSPMVSYTALENASQNESPIEFGARGIVGKSSTDAFHLRFKVSNRFKLEDKTSVEHQEDDEQLPPGAKSPLHSARTEKSEALTAFSDFFRKPKYDAKDQILEKRRPPPKLTVSIDPPAGVSKSVANERLRTAREKFHETSWAHYIRTYDTSTGVKKLGSDQEQLFREEKAYVTEMNRLTQKVMKWNEYKSDN